MTLLRLNQNLQYRIRADKEEASWRFVYEQIADLKGWWGWRKTPADEKWICLGLYAEEEVVERMEESSRILTLDDRLDLYLGLKKWKVLIAQKQGLN